MKKSIALLLSLFLGQALFCQNLDLRVGDPDWWESSWNAGTIDEAVFTVEPKGLYTEIGMYLTISADGYGYEKQDTLEIAFDFNLPKGSIIHDSWLWIDDIIIKADIMNRWSAIQIYEEIVDRRRDPSILFIKPEGGYQIRIYPLAGDESRKIKITYLVPTRWSPTSVSTLLPINLLAPSYLKNGPIKLITFPNAEWANPKLSDNLIPEFQPANEPFFGNCLVANIDWDEITEPAVFEVDAPWNNGVFASKLDDGEDHFYQLAFQPSNLPQSNTPRKLALLFDHESENASFGSANLFNFIKQTMPNLLTADDAFNMFFTKNNFSIERLSQDWISGDPTTVHQVLDPLGNPIADATNIEGLFHNAYDFIANHGGSADIVLFSSSTDYNPWWSDANFIIETILNGANNLDITIHVVNFQDLNTYYDIIGNNTIPIPQHDFIYKAITAQTGGIYAGKYPKSGILWENILNTLETITSEPILFDLNTDIAAGFTWGRHLLEYGGQSSYANRPILQVGRYEGGFPFELEFNALTPTGWHNETRLVPESDILSSDSLARESWVGLQLDDMGSNNLGDSEIQAMIELSIKERVLCDYTAFIALEPSQGGEPCFSCWGSGDGGTVINTVEEFEKQRKIELSAMPNPMSVEATLTLSWLPEFGNENVIFECYDAQGRLVRTLRTATQSNTEVVSVSWDGRDEMGNTLPSGTYYVVAKTSKGTAHCKVLKVN